MHVSWIWPIRLESVQKIGVTYMTSRWSLPIYNSYDYVSACLFIAVKKCKEAALEEQASGTSWIILGRSDHLTDLL